ncbi:peptidase inhibitor I78 [Phenylobacterium sp.]|uniref:peptidase inhibitor I78 n=1 Tax=Phenylobacterium sp. TaxID=1871053 RepID=UPI0025F6B785|nr:peptidase inhibitor I78 [Phenylobacterium sp.]MBX3483475.1 peptidase inhibitor I78 [Phenylobacterium sp.]MCW5758930.1 peptidase inhibitor I78 [Phenylobacterium sp.]
MRRVALAVTLIALAGCSTPAPPEPPPPPPLALAPAPPPPPPPDTCGAREHQDLVGRPRTEIPIPLDPARQRVACTTCPMTMDFRPERLNFFFDAKTGLIQDVRCG